MNTLYRVITLINNIQKIIMENKEIYSEEFPKVCSEVLGNEIQFAIYTKTSKGFLKTFSYDNTNSILKDILNEIEIMRKVKSDEGFLYFDLLVLCRRCLREKNIRVLIPNLSLLSDEEQKLLGETIENFYHFQDLYDKNYVFKELLGILKETTEVEDIDEVIEKTTKITKKLLGVQGSSILLVDEKTNELYFKVVDSEKGDKIKEIRIPADKGIAGYTARTGNPLIVNDVRKYPEFYSDVDEKSGFITKSIMSAPIKPLNKIIGVIEAVNKIKETNFSNNDLEILQTIADILGVNLVNSILYQKLNRISTNIIKSLITALEARDEYTKGHSYRVQIYSVKIAHALRLPPRKVRQVELSSILHDIGKIGVPDNILRKPDRLTDEEFEIIKKHPITGYNILSSIEGLEDILDGIKYHHERFDGRGYPEGLKGKDIPLIARIIAIADTLDAMTSDRPYRKGFPFEYALEELKNVKGTQLDPEIVDVFLGSFTNIEEILPRN